MTEVTEAVMKTDLPFANKRQGKVRDLYDITLPDGSDGLLIIATDRVSVFDVVLANGIPGKGVMLTKISEFWFNFFEGFGGLVIRKISKTYPETIDRAYYK